jgi:hypothetical protein
MVVKKNLAKNRKLFLSVDSCYLKNSSPARCPLGGGLPGISREGFFFNEQLAISNGRF